MGLVLFVVSARISAAAIAKLATAESMLRAGVGVARAAPVTPRAARLASSLAAPHRAQLFLNNEWRDASDGATLAVENPATEETLFHCARATAEDVDTAVRGARACFRGPEWGKQSASAARGDMLRKMASGLQQQKEDFSVLESLDNGKPLVEARADMDVCIGLLEYYAGLADSFDEERTTHVQTSDTDFNVRLVAEPAGVVGLVTPWNFPLMQAVAKVAPAIAAGCAMVLKPSSVCPATCLRLGDLAIDAGLPPGALQIISGTGREAGSALLDHRLIDRLSFTGSSGVGHTVLAAAAKRLVPASMELGGKGAIVVFDDVQLEACGTHILV